MTMTMRVEGGWRRSGYNAGRGEEVTVGSGSLSFFPFPFFFIGVWVLLLEAAGAADETDGKNSGGDECFHLGIIRCVDTGHMW